MCFYTSKRGHRVFIPDGFQGSIHECPVHGKSAQAYRKERQQYLALMQRLGRTGIQTPQDKQDAERVLTYRHYLDDTRKSIFATEWKDMPESTLSTTDWHNAPKDPYLKLTLEDITSYKLPDDIDHEAPYTEVSPSLSPSALQEPQGQVFQAYVSNRTSNEQEAYAAWEKDLNNPQKFQAFVRSTGISPEQLTQQMKNIQKDLLKFQRLPKDIQKAVADKVIQGISTKYHIPEIDPHDMVNYAFRVSEFIARLGGTTPEVEIGRQVLDRLQGTLDGSMNYAEGKSLGQNALDIGKGLVAGMVANKAVLTTGRIIAAAKYMPALLNVVRGATVAIGVGGLATSTAPVLLLLLEIGVTMCLAKYIQNHLLNEIQLPSTTEPKKAP
ncbi:MAG: hypothetical protein ACKO37_08855 [Vampirovibrionales bacterium]